MGPLAAIAFDFTNTLLMTLLIVLIALRKTTVLWRQQQLYSGECMRVY